MLEEGNAARFWMWLYRYQADLMIAGGRNMYTAYKARLPFLDINQEREHAFAGYKGNRHPRPPAVSDHRQSHLAANPCPRPVALRSSPWQTFSAPINRWRSAPSRPASPLGAILASLGIEHSIPLVHGAQGCSAFAKVFFIQHFHDPVPLQSTAMDPTSTIMGADGNIFTALDTLCQRNAPQAIVLLSTGLSEAQGSDISRVVRQFREEYPRHKGVAILTVNTPDFYGSMENGFSAVLESVIEQWMPPAPRPAQRNRRVNLLVSHLCSPGDIEWLRRCVEAFGLQPIILPDLAQSMDGHLAQGDFSPLTQGGTPLRQIEQMGQSLCSFAIGVSLHRASSLLAPRCRGEVIALPHLMTLDRCDVFIHQLAKISGRAVPAWLERQRGPAAGCDDRLSYVAPGPAHGDSGGRRSAGSVV